MRLRIKDHLWIIGLSAAILLLLNVSVQGLIHKRQAGDTRIPENTLPVEYKEPAVISRPANPVRESKIMFAKLELLGTIMGNPSLAFIYEPQTQSRRLYKTNDRIGDFIISKILSGKVMLEKDGKGYELFLTSRENEPAKVADSFLTKDGSGTMIVSKFQMIGQMFKAKDTLAKIKIVPLAGNEPNKLSGFRIDNVPSGSVIEEAGIKNGDIIYSVQGQRLQSMQSALSVFNRIQNQSRIEVVLLRNDQPVTLRYEIQ
jgi:type II secretory pathway component PulC